MPTVLPGAERNAGIPAKPLFLGCRAVPYHTHIHKVRRATMGAGPNEIAGIDGCSHEREQQERNR